MIDFFGKQSDSLQSPARHLAEITPDDGADLPFVSRAIAVAGSGHVAVQTASGDTGRVFVAAGVPFPLRVTRVLATGTTATGIVVLA